MDDESDPNEQSGLLVGRDPATAKHLLAVALAVFVAVFVLVTPSEILGFEIPFAVSLWTLFLLTAVLPTVGAFANDGVLVSVALAAGPSFGFYLPLTIFDLAYPSSSVAWGVGTASMFALPLGLLGFAVGAGARRLATRARNHL